LELSDIREMLDAADGRDRHAALTRHRAELAERIAQLQAALDLIDCALACDHDDIADCAPFRSTIAARITPG
jgi:MerR family copper efflux transcriptional regulator